MLAENIQVGALITAAVGFLLSLLGKIPGFQGTWKPNVAVLLGAILAIVADALGMIAPDPSFAESITIGVALGAAAVGSHNVMKRIGSGGGK